MSQNPDQKLPFLPFALPELGDEEIAEVVDTLRSGWITTGPKAKRFEQAFAEFLNEPQIECIAVNSATAGLHLALEALGIGPGDEVITTTHTFTATAEVVRYMGADVKLVDIDPKTMNIALDQIEAAITPRTKAIIPVHYAGLAVDMLTLLDIARRHGLKVVEDAAHALPTTLEKELIGTMGSNATVFSFYANKTMTTGEGGMLVTRDAELAKRARVMRLHGINRDAFDRFTAKVPSWYYEIVAPGFKYNLTDIAAAMGLHQLKRLPAFQRRREQIAARYFEALADLPLILPPQAPEGDVHSWHLYVLRLTEDAPIGRDEFIERLFEQGIGCSVHYVPLHQHPYWKERYGLTPEMFPESQKAYERTVTIPLYTAMTDDQVERVIAAVRRALGA
ncbi:dTDP-4-amino-4,6-dideoxygalactose transaminase [Mitsuaria sp. BK045]|jgi:dTDP-4-amino-4,6-dideoxygalactose transaminase|uniref:DegT/DnrJ/EryC1/StrS family aminotransferase n=1 Tax=unclassified Roseateles TaxID=2626991 RepID=UPI00160B5917|nr:MULTISPECIES: DegT/DnrJ/EryC1/StrS aminotransferase family protein [unclassified Roseateles]MBB3294952.1 dTDP-4-amino-4,6-dideoxygalactose transaminase [Mitsuaria sp. BK041]MBB3364168.1 dTDP-4-amino-4,6-dideoxygalactose transaminase [Mitsuaria sp. BK045]